MGAQPESEAVRRFWLLLAGAVGALLVLVALAFASFPYGFFVLVVVLSLACVAVLVMVRNALHPGADPESGRRWMVAAPLACLLVAASTATLVMGYPYAAGAMLVAGIVAVIRVVQGKRERKQGPAPDADALRWEE